LNLILILTLLSGAIADDFEVPPDRFYSTTTVNVEFLGFQEGDCMHPVVRGSDGQVISLWSFDDMLNYFLSLHVNEEVILDLEEVDSYVMAAEEMVHMLRVTEAEAGGRTYTAWKDSVLSLGDADAVLGNITRALHECMYTGSALEGGR